MDDLRFRTFLGVIAIAACGACGARSDLLSEDTGAGGGGAGGSGGSGGATTTSTTSTTTTTTTVLPEGPCPVLEVATPFAGLSGGAQVHQRSPKLAYSSDDKTQVTIASAWQATEGPGPNLPIELRHTTFKAWPNFPAGGGLAPTYLADFDAGVSFAIAESPGNRFAMMYRDFMSPPAGGLRFSAAFAPGSGGVPASYLLFDPLNDALFLAKGDKTWLYGAVEKIGDAHKIHLGIANDLGWEVDFLLACTDQRGLADGVAIDGGFLAAYGSSATPADICGPTPADPPSGPVVVRIADTDFQEVFALGFSSIEDLKMAPRKGGAWIVWRTPSDGDVPPLTWMAAVTSDGGVLVEPQSLLITCEPDTMAVTSFEDFLVLACLQAEPEGLSPFVQVVAPDGAPRGNIKVAANGAALGRVSLLGSPFGRSALLAWSDTAGDGDQVRLTRVDCVEQN
jgi:hypothetical protein